LLTIRVGALCVCYLPYFTDDGNGAKGNDACGSVGL
jgi:hypothetical protein